MLAYCDLDWQELCDVDLSAEGLLVDSSGGRLAEQLLDGDDDDPEEVRRRQRQRHLRQVQGRLSL